MFRTTRRTSPGRARPSPREGALQRLKTLNRWRGLATIKRTGPRVPVRPPRVGRGPRRSDRRVGKEQFSGTELSDLVFQQPVLMIAVNPLFHGK